MSPAAKAAKAAFHETLRAKGRRLDQECLDDAWERASEAAIDLAKGQIIEHVLDHPEDY